MVQSMAKAPMEGRKPLLRAWPIDSPTDWLGHVNRAESAAELEGL